jgi:hypothetical protein
MKKQTGEDNELRPEYDLSELLKGPLGPFSWTGYSSRIWNQPASAAFPGTALLKSMPDDRPRGPLSMPQDVEVGLVTSTVTDSLLFFVGSPSDWTHRVTDSVSRSGASEGAMILMYRACDPPLGRVTCAPGTV